jgi:hypothetical protein
VTDPGWKPAIPIALRIATLRSVDADLLLTLRGITVFALATSTLLVPMSYLATLGVEPSGASTEASFVVGAVVVLGGLSVFLGLRPVDQTDTVHLAASLFRQTTLRVVLGAAPGGAGLVAAFMSGEPVLGLVGTLCAVVMIGLAAPTRGRVDAWQEAVDESGLSVRQALQIRYRRR